MERTFQTKREGGVFNYNHIYYGKVPETIIYSGLECIQQALKEDRELEELERIATNSSEKFEKTRVRADQKVKKLIADFDFEAYHPLFDGMVDKVNNEFLAKMKKYKPKTSHFGYEQANHESKQDIIKLTQKLEHRCQEFKGRREARKHAKEAEQMDDELALTQQPQEPELDEDALEREQKVA
jgi:hypothetical protein